MIIWSLAVMGYFLIGAFVDAHVESDGFLLFLWLPIFLFICVAAPIYGAYWLGKKAVGLPKYLIDRNKPPSPSDIVRGVIATVVLRHLEGWDFNSSSPQYKYKNIAIVRRADSIGNLSWRVSVSGEGLSNDAKLVDAINKSRSIAEEKRNHKIKYEKDLRMLEGLQEFMDTPPILLKDKL